MRTTTLFAALVLCGAVSAQEINGHAAPTENDFYTVDYLVPPSDARVEVGGLDFLPDGRLVLSTRRGQVWIVDDPLAKDPKSARFHLFAEGLQEGLGLEVVDGEIYVLQRTELSRLRDTDKDGTCDTIDTICNTWGNSGNYHEFAFGLPRDREGNFYITLNLMFGDPWWHGQSIVPWRGWAMKISPDGKLSPVSSGLRSPCGLGTNAEGDVFVTDNQGDWVPACPIVHVKEGRFFGHPASLRWTPEYDAEQRTPSFTDPPTRERAQAAVWIPYDWSRSAGNLVADMTGGKFGPFGEQLFVAELTNGLVLRAQLEKVRGEYQGAVFPFRQHVGSAVRLRFASDGTLFTGFTDRGWGGQPPGDGVARLRWTGKVPFEIQSVHLLQRGFEVAFTEPLKQAPSAANIHLQQYDYNYWWEYGSPTTNVTPVDVTEVALSPDRKRLTFQTAGLKAAMVARCKIDGATSANGAPLLHDEFAYTIDQLPEGPPTTEHVAKLVAPPIARETWAQGVLFLAEGDALDAWKGTGWRTGRVELDPNDPTRLAPKPVKPENASSEGGEAKRAPENVVLTNVGASEAEDLVSKLEFGDCEVHVEFMVPKDGNSGVYLMGRYEVQILDSTGKTELGFGDCGGIYQGWGEGNHWPGAAPMFNAFKGPGKWHDLDIRFQAPRFDAQGKKTSNAKFLRVRIDDTLLHENVEVANATRGGFEGEVPLGPLRLQGDHGPIAYRNVTVRPTAVDDGGEGWTRIFDGKTLDGWKISDGGKWKVEDGMIVGSGEVSHLFSPRDDYTNLEFRAKVKISDAGNSGMYFRVAYGPGWPDGYEAQVNSTGPDPVKTGSLYNLSLVKARLVPPDTWFTQHVICRDEPAGVHVTIVLDGVVVNDFVDKERKHAKGHVAFQQHNDGSVVRYKDVEVREIR